MPSTSPIVCIAMQASNGMMIHMPVMSPVSQTASIMMAGVLSPSMNL